MADITSTINRLSAEKVKEIILNHCTSPNPKIQQALSILFSPTSVANVITPPVSIASKPTDVISKKEMKTQSSWVSTRSRANRSFSIVQKALPTLDDILAEPVLLQSLNSFLSSRFADENLLFWKACKHYQESFPTHSPKKRFDIAFDIYMKFISQDSEHQVNITAKANTHIKKQISNYQENNVELDVELFNCGITEVVNMLKFDCYPKYIKSEEFSKANQMLSKIRRFTTSLPSSERKLTPRQQKLLSLDADEVYLGYDEILVNEGDRLEYLYRLERGKVAICTKTKTGPLVIIEEVSTIGSIFCDLSVVGRIRSNTSIISKSADTKILKINSGTMISILEVDTSLAVKFFQYLAKKLAMWIRNSSIDAKALSWFGKPYHNEIIDDKLVEYTKNTFNELPSSEIPIAEFTFSIVQIRKNITNLAKIVITQNFCCIEHTSFDVILLSQLQTETKDSTEIQLIYGSKKLLLAATSKKSRALFLQVIFSRMSLSFASRSKFVSHWFTMNRGDWNTLLNMNEESSDRTPACIIKFHIGEVIVNAGQKHPLFAHIVNGSVTLTPAGCTEPTRFLGHTELIGEVEYLCECEAQDTIIAAENETTLCIIDTNFLKQQFSDSSPLLVSKFHKHLCQTLSTRLRSVNAQSQ